MRQVGRGQRPKSQISNVILHSSLHKCIPSSINPGMQSAMLLLTTLSLGPRQLKYGLSRSISRQMPIPPLYEITRQRAGRDDAANGRQWRTGKRTTDIRLMSQCHPPNSRRLRNISFNSIVIEHDHDAHTPKVVRKQSRRRRTPLF
jgi:hypothetical protein